ncbi:unnamed protein product [Somion occarium]|uniref:Uncharacterized protein n=1 Tax=Somion occarium TaxID=3059160 RepID=A0ABP1CF12_9APHY
MVTGSQDLSHLIDCSWFRKLPIITYHLPLAIPSWATSPGHPGTSPLPSNSDPPGTPHALPLWRGRLSLSSMSRHLCFASFHFALLQFATLYEWKDSLMFLPFRLQWTNPLSTHDRAVFISSCFVFALPSLALMPFISPLS